MEDTIVMLMAPPRYIPLSRVACHPSGRVVCRPCNPDDPSIPGRLLAVLRTQQAYPCLLKDPLRQEWQAFEAFLTHYQGLPDVRVTLMPTGAIRTWAAPTGYEPLPMGRQDRGHPRPRRVPAPGKD